ncbi:MAG: sigma-70 family RNA polymerase sigma factor [Planctomycetes bacterium]|nr:sigma-70 family RNA polymerase sigma factor [Planctomycetota bacterium]
MADDSRSNEDDAVEALVRDAHQGAEPAVRSLLERFLPDLQAYVDRQMGKGLREHESRADIVQSVCREVLEGLARERFAYRGEAPFRGWLFQSALSKIRQRARHHGAEHRAMVQPVSPTSPALAEALATSIGSPSREASDREEHARLLAAFERLEPAQREIISWARLEGLSHREIAGRLGTTEGNSRLLLARALSKLAKLAGQQKPGAP